MSDFVHIESPSSIHQTGNASTTPKPSPSLLAFLDAHPLVRPAVIDKIYGCIIGSALGDTIGLYTEFMTKAQSAKVYADRQFRLVEPATELYPDSHRTRFAPCAWTDDTDQALLIILSYIQNYADTPHGSSRIGHANEVLGADFAKRLRIWVEQGLLALGRHPCGLGALVGSVVTDSKYLDDPIQTATRKWIKSKRFNAPNGSLMRTHPIGIIGIGLSEEETWNLSAGVGTTTHVDPRCTVSCCIEVALIRGILRGEISGEKDIDACIERSYEWVRRRTDLMNPGGDTSLSEYDISRHLERKEFERHVYAQEFEELKLDNHKQLGYVYKCLGSSILALRLAMRANKGPLAKETIFETITVDLIMEGGDADTNAAAACSLLGAYLGYSNLPSHWTLGLAHKEWLVSKTYRLAIACGVVEGHLEAEKDEAPTGPNGLMNREQLDARWAKLIEQMLLKKQEAEQRAKAEKNKKDKKGIVAWFAK